MGQEEFHEPAELHGNDAKLTAEVAALSVRVEALERELAELRDRKDNRTVESAAVPAPAIVPPPPSPSPQASFENKLGAQIFNRVGVILMAISFAYQKDWLALRDPAWRADQRSGGGQ